MNNNFVSENSPTPADLLSEAIKKGNYFSAVDGEYPDNHIMVFCNFGIITGRVEDRVVVLYLQPEKEDEWLPLPETSSWKREIHRGIELIVTKIKYEHFECDKLALKISVGLDELKKYYIRSDKYDDERSAKRIIKQ